MCAVGSGTLASDIILSRVSSTVRTLTESIRLLPKSQSAAPSQKAEQIPHCCRLGLTRPPALHPDTRPGSAKDCLRDGLPE